MIKLNISKEEINIFTDGSCSGNPGPGGWSGVIIHDLISIFALTIVVPPGSFLDVFPE